MMGSYTYPAGEDSICDHRDYSSVGLYWQTSRDLIGALLILLYLKAIRFLILVRGEYGIAFSYYPIV